MSKSADSQAGLVEILDEPAAIEKKIKRAVTDAETEIRFDEVNKPGVSNLLTIASTMSGRSIADLETDYAGKGYGALKTEVADIVVSYTRPIRERTQQWLADVGELDRVLADGAGRARDVAERTLAAAYDAVGFLPAGV
jgi:tryptophanyl-tRNA synthetase